MLKTRIRHLALIFGFTMLFSGAVTSPSYSPDFERKLVNLSQRGYYYSFPFADMIELHNPQTGFHQTKSLKESSVIEIYAWANSHHVPVLEIDPSQIDTTPYIGWYTFWTGVPLSNGVGAPLLVADLNRNGEPEVYGIFKDYTTGFMARAYEIDANGLATLRNTYSPRVFTARHAVDVDGDSLWEVMFDSSQVEYSFQQVSPDSIPTSFKFAHRMWEYSSYVSPNFVGDLDGDNKVDFLYRGDQLDTSCGGITCEKTYVAEYSSSVGNFRRVSSILWLPYRLGGDIAVQGYAVGDFDNDGHKEFIASSIWGNLFVGKNIGDDTYAEVWRDSLPYVNMYYQTQGDVDNDGWMEFFVGATMSSGYWLTAFEADSINHYSPRFLFHILAGGSLDEPTNLTADIDGDGIPELVILTGGYILIFKSDANNSYYLWCLKPLTFGYAVGIYDFNHDGKQDFIISGDEVSGENLRVRAEIYLATFVMSVSDHTLMAPPREFKLYQNFPNPFNPSTVIKYQLPADVHVVLTIYDILGRQVSRLVDEAQKSGYYEIPFDASRLASGVYFYRLNAGQFTDIKKMIIMK